MKLVWLSHLIPFPPRGGSRQRTYNLVRQASRHYEICLVALNLLGEGKERVDEYQVKLRQHCAEVVVWGTPFLWKGVRWWAQLALSPLYRHHYAARSLWSPQLDAKWRDMLARYAGALVHLETIDLALYFPAVREFLRVLDHQNCESAMAERRAETETNPLKKAYLSDQARKILRLEQHWCPRVDINLAVSNLDAARLQSRCPGAHFHVVENGTDPDYFAPSDVSVEPQTLVFAGDLSWYPNVSAIRFFVREIWPQLRKEVLGIRIYVVGRRPTPEIARLAERQAGIVLVPDPEDIRPWVARAAVFVCPIIDGGGTRLKILDALAMGIPVVTTSIGCEGLSVNHGEHVLVADTAQDFARQVIRALRDNSLRALLSARARALAEEHYSWGIVGRQLIQAYDQVRGPKK